MKRNGDIYDMVGKNLYAIIIAAAAAADWASRAAARGCGVSVHANAGAAFGLFKNSPMLVAQVSFFCLALVLWVIFRSKSAEDTMRRWLSLSAGGVAANLISRLVFGGVFDWIYLPFSRLVFEKGLYFNVADAEIGLGLLCAAFLLLKNARAAK